MKDKYFSIPGIIILCMIIFSGANGQPSVDSKESARVFVQKFYDWYGAMDAAAIPGDKSPGPMALSLRHKPAYFESKLKDAINADEAAQAKVPGEIVGLDFDPITNAQDTRSGYQTGNVKQQRDNFFVDIHDIKSGQSRKAVLAAELVVTAEVAKINGQWEFINFIYPKADGGRNLLDILKGLKKDRVKWGYEKTK
jgi:hypothetical protein